MSTSTGDLAFQATGVSDQAQQMLQDFWPKGLDAIRNLNSVSTSILDSNSFHNRKMFSYIVKTRILFDELLLLFFRRGLKENIK